MKNKEYVLQNHTDDLLSTVYVYGLCELCHTIGCAEYCKSPKAPHSCKETFKSWLDQEHTEPLRYPIGTVVEVKMLNGHGNTMVGYYNSVDNNGNHYICSYKENIGKTENQVPICTVKVNSNDVDRLIKKVGD